MFTELSSNHRHVLFPYKLHQMLDDCEKHGLTDVVSWLPGGTCFKVHRVDEFVDKILPSYFKQTKYKSFQRQLNLWGFSRQTKKSKEKGSYRHKQFLQSQQSLCRYMTRQRCKKNKKPKDTPKEKHSRDQDMPSQMKSLDDAKCPQESCKDLNLSTGISDDFSIVSDLECSAAQGAILKTGAADHCFEDWCSFYPIERETFDDVNMKAADMALALSKHLLDDFDKHQAKSVVAPPPLQCHSLACPV